MNKVMIRKIEKSEKDIVNDIVEIHLATFKGFFLTFMGRGFLRLMYRSYVEHGESGILVAFEEEKPVGFLAYSGDMSGLYKYMIKKRLVLFAWYSLGAFFRKPAIFMRLVRAFLKPSESVREDKYIELASIGVSPEVKAHGFGSSLIEALKNDVEFSKFKYITLETDAVDNEIANKFYVKNGFKLERQFITAEGRRMNEYRYTQGL